VQAAAVGEVVVQGVEGLDLHVAIVPECEPGDVLRGPLNRGTLPS
jgi:hypothetical protein